MELNTLVQASQLTLIKTQQSTDQNYHRKQQRKQFVVHVSKSNTWLENLQSNQIYNKLFHMPEKASIEVGPWFPIPFKWKKLDLFASDSWLVIEVSMRALNFYAYAARNFMILLKKTRAKRQTLFWHFPKKKGIVLKAQISRVKFNYAASFQLMVV